MTLLRKLICKVFGHDWSDKYAVTRGLSALSGLPPICLRCNKPQPEPKPKETQND